MIFPRTSRHLRTAPVDFAHWRRLELNVSIDEAEGSPLDEHSMSIPADRLPDGTETAFRRCRDALLRLSIFPSRLVTLHADSHDGRATEGATVIERVNVGPLGFEAAVRIITLTAETGPPVAGSRFEMTWATVEGHPEQGVETFGVEWRDDGSLKLTIRAGSRPAMLAVRLASPLTRLIQRRYSRAALDRLAAVARGSKSQGRSP